jgi:hypothetical protein
MFTLQKRHTSSPLGHSADVSLHLHVADQTIPLCQTSNTAVKLRQDVHVSPGPARVEIITDGVSHFSDVTITGREPDSLWLNIV